MAVSTSSILSLSRACMQAPRMHRTPLVSPDFQRSPASEQHAASALGQLSSYRRWSWLARAARQACFICFFCSALHCWAALFCFLPGKGAASVAREPSEVAQGEVRSREDVRTGASRPGGCAARV
eukprot:1466166-Pyramimonas_sp.AAC.1